jgi:hypothetical protein
MKVTFQASLPHTVHSADVTRISIESTNKKRYKQALG